MRIKNIVFICLIVMSLGIQAQDTNYVRQVIRTLASEPFHGRGYSYKGDSIAAQFLRSELQRNGIKPIGTSYLHPYTFSAFSMEGPLTLSVNGQKLFPYKQFRVPAWSQSTWGDFKTLTLPAETLLDADKLRRFLKKNNDLLQDVFVYVNLHEFSPKSEKEKNKMDEIVQGFRQRNPFNSKGIIVAMEEMNTYSPAYTNYEHGYAYIEVLAAAMPKRVKTINCAIFTQFHRDYATQNVIGIVPGEVDTMVVFTAHYDHLGTMGDEVTFYGAHDNASGVAAVLDLARLAVSEKPHYTQVFCFFSGEEAGLVGSKYASQHPPFDLNKVRLLVNIDMFCGGDEGLMVFNSKAPETQPFIERLETLNNALNVVPEIRRRENRPNSDHFHFSKQVPALFILTMGQRYGGYHDPEDTCERCGLENYLNYITLISSLAL